MPKKCSWMSPNLQHTWFPSTTAHFRPRSYFRHAPLPTSISISVLWNANCRFAFSPWSYLDYLHSTSEDRNVVRFVVDLGEKRVTTAVTNVKPNKQPTTRARHSQSHLFVFIVFQSIFGFHPSAWPESAFHILQLDVVEFRCITYLKRESSLWLPEWGQVSEPV